MATVPIFPGLPHNEFTQIDITNSGFDIIYTPGANGSRVYAIHIGNSAGIDIEARLYTVGQLVYTVWFTIPATAGTNAIKPAFELFEDAVHTYLQVDNNGNKYMNLGPADVLRLNHITTMGGESLLINVYGSDY